MGMSLKDTVVSNYIKIDDLPGAENCPGVDVSIVTARMTRFQDGKPSLELTFNEIPKILSVNVTCRKRLMLMFGEACQLDNLAGRRIRLLPELTQDLQGNPMWSVWLGPIPGTQQDRASAARQQIDEAIVSRKPSATPTNLEVFVSRKPSATPTNTPQEPARFTDEEMDQSEGSW